MILPNYFQKWLLDNYIDWKIIKVPQLNSAFIVFSKYGYDDIHFSVNDEICYNSGCDIADYLIKSLEEFYRTNQPVYRIVEKFER